MKKVKRMLVSFGMAMTMMLNLSAVSYAVQLPQPQLPLSLMIGQTAPVSMEQSQYSLQLSQAPGQAHRSYRPVAFSAAADRKAGGYGRAALFPGGHPLHPYRQSPDRRAVHPKEPTVQLGNRDHRHRPTGHFAGALGK